MEEEPPTAPTRRERFGLPTKNVRFWWSVYVGFGRYPGGATDLWKGMCRSRGRRSMGWCRAVVSPLQFVKENGLKPFKNLAQNIGLTFSNEESKAVVALPLPALNGELENERRYFLLGKRGIRSVSVSNRISDRKPRTEPPNLRRLSSPTEGRQSPTESVFIRRWSRFRRPVSVCRFL
ncbi:hypothetical protein TIFTF001_031063 [Ficus carica]|uniref:Uncharacterized protein n=1 Tax=Ficus carica TaxID=3494 RepID=A0AA88J4N2_FICCA|nr:hypothetical protein TIFTF001_031063 [Ficus carica]